ncbi:hypothetical protein [Xylella fastidiosa]|nr:hypothetical protein [Xylella fastidiosa]MDD0873081.1 hypothetical protein [Xylella fastidiosa subsp. multiplex]MDD0875315.1 hypothetical protein [Xylella fastidiosa subsp. multiplex]MDD0879575.1 hypothetical protein [Xylella fastidiosa subsp. multiplex]MDD0881767.1 hypothetical protein [Xylella fastidiosa subsp. multiplex]MDD0890416.1 hypothetical protein [Xylella fastidiosa subsp. multiplex]
MAAPHADKEIPDQDAGAITTHAVTCPWLIEKGDNHFDVFANPAITP